MDVEQRFERVAEGSGGGKIRNRGLTADGIDLQKASPGDFLSRLWALFGPPNSLSDEGFEYYLRDRQTGLVFEAYSGASGPAYAGPPLDVQRLMPVLEAFDEMLDATSPVDCAIEFPADFGRYRIGSRSGQPFETLLEIGDRELAMKIQTAAEVLQQPNADPWIYCNALLELTNAWGRAPDELKNRETQGYRLLARSLWVKAFASIEDNILEKFDTGKPDTNSSTETLSQVALVQLKEVADKCGIDWNAFEERYQSTLAQAAEVLARREE